MPSLLKTKDATQVFLEGVSECKEFHRALKIVNKNSDGRAWLIGGFIFRTIAWQLYGSPKPKVDLDFIIEKPAKKLILPSGWIAIKNRFGNPKFIKGKNRIDFIPLENVFSIKSRKIKPTINNFLTGVPLTIQAVVFDTKSNRILGDFGINAIQNKVVEVNNLFFAQYAAKKKGKILNEYIKDMAESLDFKAIYPNETD